VWAVGLASLSAVVTLLYGTMHAGSWLVVEDALLPGAAIVVLNGEAPERAASAAALYHAGWAPEIWLTQHPPNDELDQRIRRGENVGGTTGVNVRALHDAGVPSESIRILREPIRGTADELRAVRAAARGACNGPLIIVTSPPHTRRVKVLWNRIGGQRPIVVRAAESFRWDLAHWWRHKENRLAVVHELAGLIAAQFAEEPPTDAEERLTPASIHCKFGVSRSRSEVGND
jgi:uncharacterized SAM-binding protein YcdF (DUF218 family)